MGLQTYQETQTVGLPGGDIIEKEIHVQSLRLFDVLHPAFKELGTKIVHKPALKKLRAAKRELLAFFAKGPPKFHGGM
jgi:hypothetical protein